MSLSTLQIDGVRITSPAEYLRYINLTESASNDDLRTKSRDDVQNIIKSQESIQTDKSRVTALIIGINTYKNQGIMKLKGAVADANAIKQYLEKTLRVPGSRIRTLTEERATRQNIINAFIALENDRKIDWGDAILIYYAGHGQQVAAPEGWATENVENKIQSIVPHDFDGKGIHVIPDYTLGWLIYNISRRHGDNITVIFDCCHAGSGTRTDDPDHLARTAYLDKYSIPANLDVDLGCYPSEPDGNRSKTPLSGPSLSSHVLLAACSATEGAHEMNGRGKFTVSLEAALKAISPDQISYVELLDRLDNIAGQNPQLEGNNRHRIVFNSKATVPAHHPHKIHLTESGNYVLQAGAADGVCQGAQFTVYATFSSIFKEPLGTVVAEAVGPFKTTTRPIEPSALEIPLNTPAYAVQTHAGEKAALKVYMSMTEDLMPAFSAQLLQQKDPGANQYNISPVQDPSIADLELQRDGDEIRFLILDPTVRQYDMTECIHKAPTVAQDLRPVLQGAAHYYYHLRRSSPNSNTGRNIEVEFFRLEKTGKYDLSMGELGRPLRRTSGDNLVKSGIVFLDIADGDETVYGLVITNRGKEGLYPSLFYFDNSELSINCYYKSAGPSNYEVDSPLKKEGGKLTIGFGDGGGTAFEYYIPDGRDVDVGFLKCFFSTVPVDLSKVEQASPFNFSRALKQTMVRIPGFWDSITIPIVQRRLK